MQVFFFEFLLAICLDIGNYYFWSILFFLVKERYKREFDIKKLLSNNWTFIVVLISISVFYILFIPINEKKIKEEYNKINDKKNNHIKYYKKYFIFSLKLLCYVFTNTLTYIFLDDKWVKKILYEALISKQYNELLFVYNLSNFIILSMYYRELKNLNKKDFFVLFHIGLTMYICSTNRIEQHAHIDNELFFQCIYNYLLK
jgi:hypothetical protein